MTGKILVRKKKKVWAKPSVTHKGERVKSKGERIIANVLYDLEIKYKYEIPLIISKSLSSKKYTFEPDFYLTEFNIYIEYFGMVSNKSYREKTKWKRSMYKKNNIRLISIYPYHLSWSKPKFSKWILICIKKLNNL